MSVFKGFCNEIQVKWRDIRETGCPSIFSLLGQGPVFEVEFFVDPKNETKKTNKPPAMQVCSQIALASSKKPPVI